MSRQPGQGRRPRRTAVPVDPVTALHRYAVTLFDQGNGRAVDWPKMAETLFKVAFTCLDEAAGDDRAAKVVRRVHDGAYNRMVGNADSGLPYTPDLPLRPPVGSAPELHPERSPEARRESRPE